jgi:hypothetical protein
MSNIRHLCLSPSSTLPSLDTDPKHVASTGFERTHAGKPGGAAGGVQHTIKNTPPAASVTRLPTLARPAVCLPAAALLGVMFAIIAWVRTKGGGHYLRGLAICGLWVGVWFIAACAAPNSDGLVTGTVESGESLRVGECLDETPQLETPQFPQSGGTTLVGCEQPHSDEVFAVLSLSRFPNIPTDSAELDKGCKAELANYSPSGSRDPNVGIVLVSPGTNWKYMDDHTEACLAHFSADRVGSIKG